MVDGGQSEADPAPTSAADNSSSSVDSGDNWCTPPWSCSSLSLSIPATVAEEPDSYFCTALPVGSEHQTLTKFIPKARQEVVHHMLVYACESKPEPKRPMKVRTKGGEEIEVWNCLEEPTCVSSSSNYETGKIIYAWALGAGNFETGPDAGFVVGSRAGIEAPYLVLQSHFLNAVSNETAAEVAEVEMHSTSKFPEKVISMSLFSHNQFSLPPQEERVEVKAKCCMKGAGSADLLAYRVHGHQYARDISLAVNNESIVSGDAQLPHFFTKDAAMHKLRQGSDWAATCAYNTEASNTTVTVGSGHNDEMCNMYLMLSSHVPFNSFCIGYYDGDGFENDKFPDCMIPEVVDVEGRLRVKNVLEMPELGQVGGLHLGYQGNPNWLLIFHRSGREMLQIDHPEPISEDVLMVWDTLANRSVTTFGRGLFNLPHGLTVDRDNNIWLTDVDSQLAYKLDPSGKLHLTVGMSNERGHDRKHLCRPTEVAVANNGDFFVSDGYCNERVVRYDARGGVVAELGLPDANVVHSLVLDDCSNTLYVADREKSHVRLLDADSGQEHPYIDLSQFGYVYSLTKDEYGNIYALTWQRDVPVRKTYLVQFQARAALYFQQYGSFQLMPIELPGIEFPHDFAVSYNFQEHALDIYVGETGPGPHGKVTSFSFAL